MKIGYIRVSTQEQNTIRQEAMMEALGVDELYIDTTTPTGKFMLTIFGAVAELEREYILQRQREGIAIAKEQGKYTGRKPIQHTEFNQVVAQWKSGKITAAEAMRKLNMTPSTFYRKAKKIR